MKEQDGDKLEKSASKVLRGALNEMRAKLLEQGIRTSVVHRQEFTIMLPRMKVCWETFALAEKGRWWQLTPGKYLCCVTLPLPPRPIGIRYMDRRIESLRNEFSEMIYARTGRFVHNL